jgi:hypothetical protein
MRKFVGAHQGRIVPGAMALILRSIPRLYPVLALLAS